MSKWSDNEFLNDLRQSDELANNAVERLVQEGEAEHVSYIFKVMTSNDEPLPEEAPAVLKEFFEETCDLRPTVDAERIEAGERAFMQHAFSAAFVLLCKALPEGYAAPSFGHVLHLSRDLEIHPYRRLLGVLQMVVNVSTSHGFESRGKAVVTAQKMRLLHAAIRTQVVPKQQKLGRFPADYEEKFGTPMNFEDMLATIMGFSYLVITGLKKLNVDLTTDEAEDLYYLWSVFAQLMGIHPPGKPESFDYVPRNLTEAEEFYTAYAARNYVEAKDNPKGVVLAHDNIKMLEDLLPRPLRWLGLKAAPRIYTWDLIGPEGCRRVGIRRVRGHAVLKWLLKKIVPLGQRWIDKHPEHTTEKFARLLFEAMLHRTWGGEVTFLLPDTLQKVRELA